MAHVRDDENEGAPPTRDRELVVTSVSKKGFRGVELDLRRFGRTQEISLYAYTKTQCQW